MAGPTHESFVSRDLAIMWGLLSVLVVLTYFIQRYKFHLVTPSAVAMVLGIAAGAVFRLAGYAKSLRFSPDAFFYGLLPPIVFAAGFSLKSRKFFNYFGAICTFAIAGTLISTVVFGLSTALLAAVGAVGGSHLGGQPLMESMLYGAAISSIDPVATLSVFADLVVPPLLYNLVFGESVLNDAVCIVLFRTVEEFRESLLGASTAMLMVWRFAVIFFGSCLMGIGVALMCAFILKRFMQQGGATAGPPSFDSSVYEMSLVVMSSYLAYLVAEVAQLSGIVALFFAGIVHAHYSYYSAMPDTRIALKKSFEFVAFLCDLFIFSYLGLQVATMKHQWDWGLILSGLPLCLLSRALNIFPLSYAINLGRKYPLPLNLQVMHWAVGLRGAVAYGLVVKIGNPAIETATLVVVVISTLVFGGATGPLLRKLELEGIDDAELLLARDHPSLRSAANALVTAAGGRGVEPRQPPSPRTVEHVRMHEIERPSWLHTMWTAFDGSVMKPIFGGRQRQEGGEHGYEGLRTLGGSGGGGWPFPDSGGGSSQQLLQMETLDNGEAAAAAVGDAGGGKRGEERGGAAAQNGTGPGPGDGLPLVAVDANGSRGGGSGVALRHEDSEGDGGLL